MKNKLYSIIIPHYNCITGLKSLLNSIPDREDIEIIVVDDNSDISLQYEMFDMFSHSHCNLIVNDNKGRGAGTCRNIALNIASGRYVVFADSDDYFTENAFEIIDDAIIKHTECDVFLFKPTSVCSLSLELSDRHNLYCDIIDNYNANKDVNELYNYVVPWSKVIRRDLLVSNDIKFDQVIASNDVMFSMKVTFHSKSNVALNDIIYCVTRRPGSLTVNKSREVTAARFKVERNRIKFIKENNLDVDTNAFIRIIKNYRSIGFLYVLKYGTKLLIKGHISFIPKSYLRLVLNPRILIKKILSPNSINNSKYRV
ncbi:glycosyltransferase family 2 protein [Vibrio sp. EA2]|uniref:glycosyltransferase family A protein n=1 Tax=Vibrio sp. EA2 TaxID=3079860 RepID=UPI0029499BCA|nr:glycosyltransferase family 2 protein [Vibrio sp. EA2]MDV6253342.1 glycosyltransferase family 2 protein [Vibrio sp. EA2]